MGLRSDLGYKPQCHDVASGRFPRETAVTNAFCSLLLGLSLCPVAQKVNAALSENEGGGQSLGKADWGAGSTQGTREAGRHPRPLAFGHGKELQQ